MKASSSHAVFFTQDWAFFCVFLPDFDLSSILIYPIAVFFVVSFTQEVYRSDVLRQSDRTWRYLSLCLCFRVYIYCLIDSICGMVSATPVSHRFIQIPHLTKVITAVPALCKFTQRGQVNSAVYVGPIRIYTEIWCNLHLLKISIQFIEIIRVNGNCHMRTVQKYIFEYIQGVYALFLL